MSASACPETELMVRLVATRARIEQSRPRIAQLARIVDYPILTGVLAEQKLLMLAGRRLEQLAPDSLPVTFRGAVGAAVDEARAHADVLSRLTTLFLHDLERDGIAAVPLKGPRIARAAYGDESMRRSSDIDLLVDPTRLDDAVSVIERRNYSYVPDIPFDGERPHLHHSLVPLVPWLPPVDVHWRIHWYEDGFSRRILARSEVGEGGIRRLRAADELATLLLFYQRDSFCGLRYAADIAAWWDAHGHELEACVLDPVLEENVELRGALVAAVGVAEELVGLPRQRLLSDRWRPTRRGRVAQRLANPTREGSETDVSIALSFVDWLLTPRGGQPDFLRRYLFQPSAVFAERHGLPETARVRIRAWQAAHGVARTVRTLSRYLSVLWSLRSAGELIPIVAVPEAHE